MYGPAYTLCPVRSLARQMVTQVHTHSCQCQVLQLLAPGMNVYRPASPFILQGLAQGTTCTQGGTSERLEVMCMQQRFTF